MANLKLGMSIYKVFYEGGDKPFFKVEESKVHEIRNNGFFVKSNERPEPYFVFESAVNRFEDELDLLSLQNTFYFTELQKIDYLLERYWESLKISYEGYIKSKKSYMEQLELSTKDFLKGLESKTTNSPKKVENKINHIKRLFDRNILEADHELFHIAEPTLRITYASSLHYEVFRLDIGYMSMIKDIDRVPSRYRIYDTHVDKEIVFFLFEDEHGFSSEAVHEHELYVSNKLEQSSFYNKTEEYFAFISEETLMSKGFYPILAEVQERLRLFNQRMIVELEEFYQKLKQPFSLANVEYSFLDLKD